MSAKCPTILCVDDVPYLLEIRKMQLQKAGYRVLTAETAEHALRLFTTAHVDLLLTDYRLPDIDGVALGLIMKRTRPDLPIVLVSGWACDLYAEHVDLVLPKPTDTAELIRQIKRLVPTQRYGT